MSDDKVQIIVPNGAVWGQPLRNYSIYPAPPRAGEVHFRLPEWAELESAIDKVRAIVNADPRVLADPPPTVLLDHSPDGAIEVVVVFHSADNEIAVMKSDLINSIHTGLEEIPEKGAGAEQSRHRSLGDGHISVSGSE